MMETRSVCINRTDRSFRPARLARLAGVGVAAVLGSALLCGATFAAESPAKPKPTAAEKATSTDAARKALIRRVTLDLLGREPTAEEVEQYLADNAPGAYERLFERLMANPKPPTAGTSSQGTPPTTAPAITTTAPAVSGGASNPTDPYPSATPQAVVAVTGRIFPAVVRLDVAQEVYAEGKRTLQRGIGSGVIIDGEGRILTNFHVAGRAAEINITLYNKERVAARLVGDDHWTDLAVVQMDMEEVRRKKIDFNYAELGESKHLIPGQDVMAVGTPFGLARTMTLGVVSNNERTFYPDKMSIDEYETGNFSNWIQMDTPINPGNSGGPLVDMTGKVVGINTRGGGQNLNFAVPIDTAREVVQKILATAKPDKKGRVDRADLGVDLKPLQDLESFYDIDINKGVLVNSVDRNSPAAKAGVKTQDILLEINGKALNVRFPEEMAAAQKMIADLPIGKDVDLSLKRGKENIHLKAKTERLEGAVGQEREMKVWGLSVRDVTRAYANATQLDDDKGVVVTTMSQGFPAQKAELGPGDVIRSVGGEAVEDLDAFVKLYDESVKKKEKAVLLEVKRGRGTRSAVLKVTY